MKNLIEKRIRHNKLGDGTIIHIDEKEQILTVRFDDDCSPIKRFLKSSVGTDLTIIDSTPQKQKLPAPHFLQPFGDLKPISGPLNYIEVEEQFGIKIQGFGRGINIKNDSIILISSRQEKSLSYVYNDYCAIDNRYIYSGEGKSGHQKMEGGNLAIKNTKYDNSNKSLRLLIKLSAQRYYDMGNFVLDSYLIENDFDEDNDIRQEIKFILKQNI